MSKKRINDPFNYACAHLPDCWGIRIDLENGFGVVTLIDPDLEETDMREDETSLEEQIVNAVEKSRAGLKPARKGAK